MDDREIYPNAPLSLVTFEARFPYAPAAEDTDTIRRIHEAVDDLLPLMRVDRVPAADGGPLVSIWRMLDRGHLSMLSIGPYAATIETSRYLRFEDFHALIGRCLEPVEKVLGASGVQRIGLRYIDEIRVPGVSTASAWRPFIDERLLAAMTLSSDGDVLGQSGAVEFRFDEHRRLMMRYGAYEGGRAVNNDGPLSVRDRGDGAFFLIDTDSFWDAARGDIPVFSAASVLEIATELRRPVRALFERSITEKLRDEVFRAEGGIDE